MADGYVERGEVYWIGKIGFATLGVIVSSKTDNVLDSFVAVATICGEEPRRGVPISVTGRSSWVACANTRTVPKKELRTLVGRLSREEMNRVDNELEEFFDLGYEDDSKDKEIESLKAKVARLEREVAYGKEGIESRNVEVAKYKRLYEKAVDQICEMTLAADVAKRIAEKTTVVAEVEEPEPEEPVEVIEELEIVEETPSRITFPVWEPPVEKPKAQEPVKKVNVNTATMAELMDLGFSKSAAGRITSHIKKYGPYKKVEDLKNVDDVPAKLVRKLKDVLEV